MNARLFPANWRPAREEIAFAAGAGFAALQFPGPEEGLGAGRLGDALEAVGAVLVEAGLTAAMEMLVRVDGEGRTAAGGSPLDVLRANLAAIGALRCACVHWHLVPLGREEVDTGAARRVEEALIPQFATGVALAREGGFRLGIEHNEPRIGLLSSPERCAAILNAVPGLGIVWDWNHTPPGQLDGYLALASRMTLLHVSDTPLPTPNWHLPLGLGTVDLQGYCRELLARGFRGPAILEIGGLPQSGGYGRDTDEALIDSRERLARAVEAAMGA